jgi:plastocyanin
MRRAGRIGVLAALCIAPALWSAPARAEVIRIEMVKVGYEPAEVTAHVGDTIEWVNHDFITHTATARNKDFDLMIGKDKTARTVVKHAGTIDYYCRFHPNMKGKITVAPQ